MNAKAQGPVRIPSELTVVATLARLLQQLEASPVPVSPQQYRSVAQRLADTLADTPPSEALNLILAAFPAAAELYENVHYQHAGLCRSPLEWALNAELKAREVVLRAASTP